MRSIAILAIGLLLGVGLMSLVSHGGHDVVFAGDTPSGNGDTNGDGTIDISDVVYVLRYLFAKGPAPVALGERFVDNGDGTVTDSLTGLMWCQDTCDTDGDGRVTVEDVITRRDADTFVAALRVGGHADWRLPTTREFYSIVDFGRTNPSIDPVFGVMSGEYWIASTNAGDPCHGSPFTLDFTAGFVTLRGTYDGTIYRSHVRAVRGGVW